MSEQRFEIDSAISNVKTDLDALSVDYNGLESNRPGTGQSRNS